VTAGTLTSIILTQSDVVDILRSDGYDVTLRTLRYWREVGLLPKLYNNGNQRGYKSSVIDTIKELCEKSGRLIGDVVFIYNIENERFKVYRYVVERPKEYNGQYRILMYTDKGLIIGKSNSYLLE
jgi:hypothetical protein